MSTFPHRFLLGLGCLVLLAGCSETTAPPVTNQNLGDLDPAQGRVTLKTLTVTPPDAAPVPLVLESGPVELLDDGATVVMDVTLRNAGDSAVSAPLVVWIGDFDPDHVSILNAEMVTPATPGLPGVYYGLDYTDLLGEDHVLDPGEVSEARRWEFDDVGFASFSFSGWIDTGFGPEPATLGGLCFLDRNQNGIREEDEPPLPEIPIVIHGPGGDVVEVRSGPDGRYGIRARDAGLYEIRVMPPFVDGPFTTTVNPLFVTLTPGPDGTPMSYDNADFGIWGPPGPPSPLPVVFTDLPPDSLQVDPWQLIEAMPADGRLLSLRVGFSGCDPHHDFTLFASGGFMESEPPQLDLTLVHETDQMCEAYLERSLLFDLGPVFDAYRQGYPPGELILNLIDFEGNTTPIPIFVP